MKNPHNFLVVARTASKAAIVIASLSFATLTQASESYLISIKEKQFSPSTIVIPANTKVKLVIKNTDAAPAEFESYELNREKVVNGNSEAVVFVGPLKPGDYPFFNEFYPTAKGTLRVQ